MFRFLQILGVMLMILGVLLFIAPLLLEQLTSLEKVPWIVLYVYHRDGFVFVTSPILIIISTLSLFLEMFSRTER